MPISRRTLPLLALLFALLHAWMAASVSKHFSPAYDETAHLIAGASYWRDDDYRLQPENGLFPQRWAALPNLIDPGLAYPDHQQPAWLFADVWELGDQWLHKLGNDPALLLRRSRIMIALLGGALVFVITLWAASLFGPKGGLAAGLLACFSPTLLAHAGLVTSDTAGALGYTTALLAWWRLCHRLSPARIALAGAAVALLALSKYSVALFPLAALLLCGIRLLHPAPLALWLGRPLQGWRRLPALAAATVAAALVTYGLIWAAYGFRYEARGPDTPPFANFNTTWPLALIEKTVELDYPMAHGVTPPNHTATIHAGPVQTLVAFGRRHELLPEAWLYGLTFVDRYSRSRLAYFNGEWSINGWRAFFPVAYLLKSTPSELLLHAFGLIVLVTGLRGSPARQRLLYRAAPLLVGILIYTGFALTSRLNIGHRHLLPIYALASVIAGGAFITFAARPRHLLLVKLLLLGALGGQATASLLVRPQYLAYFNVLAGGPDGGHRYLVDSSLDWGQNLPALKAWLDAHPASRPLHLSYFGNGDPSLLGIEATRIGDFFFNPAPNTEIIPNLQPGAYAISATMWQRVYTLVRGPWDDAYEARYQKLLAWVVTLNNNPAPLPPDRHPLPPVLLKKHLTDLEQLRFGRLLAYLRTRPPTTILAHTWLIFELTQDDIHKALYGPPASTVSTMNSARKSTPLEHRNK